MNYLNIFLILFHLIYLINSIIPPKIISNNLILNYTLNNKIPLEYYYINDTLEGNSTHYIYTTKQINSMIISTNKYYNKIKLLYTIYLENNNNNHENNENNNKDELFIKQLKKEDLIYFSLIKYVNYINNSKIGIIGSTSPWIECLLLSLNAQEITTIEYNKLTYGNQNETKIRTISYEQFDEFYNNSVGYFDILFSLSSFDHDGLGRYGDPLNPNGDLDSMKKVKTLLKPDTGLLFLTVPIGADIIVYNLHRRYGPIRLPLLLDQWDIVDRIGWNEAKFNEKSNWRQTYEPVFILKPSINNNQENNNQENIQEVISKENENNKNEYHQEEKIEL